nr:serpin family protein [Actinomycetales bacterium]
LVAATEALGVEMLRSAEEGENVVVSPASLALAFAMLAPGVTNDTVDEMTRLLGAEPAAAIDMAGAVLAEYARWGGDPTDFDPEEAPEAPFLHLANRAVVREGYEVEQYYLDELVRNFDAGLAQADFADQAAAKRVLDEWVNHHTAGLIPESAIDPHGDLVLVLQNALLFGARWETPFEEYLTRDREFTLIDGSAFQVPMMGADLISVRYVDVDGWSAIELPYTEGFVANFFLPPEGEDPASVTNLPELTEALAAAEALEVAVAIPKMDTESEVDLRELLEGLGYSAIFDCEAGSFEGIGPGLCIDQAAQQAILRVDEEGTVAAAVTEIAVGEAAAPLPEREFVADRPFLMTIRSVEPGWDLFQAAIRDPRPDDD